MRDRPSGKPGVPIPILEGFAGRHRSEPKGINWLLSEPRRSVSLPLLTDIAMWRQQAGVNGLRFLLQFVPPKHIVVLSAF